MVKKNHITADITEHFRIILTLAIHSHGNINVKLKIENNTSTRLVFDTWHSTLKLLQAEE